MQFVGDKSVGARMSGSLVEPKGETPKAETLS